jgi:chromosome segregation ATPase
MSKPEGIGDRVTRLESEMPVARQDAAAARELAAGADRDVSAMQEELRSHTRSLNALRETQVEHGAAIRELRGEMREGFGKLAAGQAQLTALITTHIEERDAGD